MRLYHATTEAAARAILEDGFAVSHVRDSKERSWLSASPDAARATSRGSEWFVIVDLDDAERYRSRFEDGECYLDNYCVPWEVLNTCRPFEVKPVSEVG